MIFKLLIVLLLILIVLNLGRALFYLLVDRPLEDKKRTLYALGIRVALAAVLLCLIFYGFYSGQFRSTAPWENHRSVSSNIR